MKLFINIYSNIFWLWNNVHLCCQVTLAAWQEFEGQQAAVREFVSKVQSVTEREMNFSSPDSLSAELEQAKVRITLDLQQLGVMNHL